MQAIKPVQMKWCATCEQPLKRKRMNGRLEDYSVFQRRKHCSLSCANTRDNVTKSALHWRARKLRKAQCESCGATTELHAHHVDGQPKNNDPKNIQTLCTHCHGFWHNVLARRGKPINGRMPQLWDLDFHALLDSESSATE